eukprot:COSAG06_NODE_57344_length_280_cov_1.430939_1_plen_23_part_01
MALEEGVRCGAGITPWFYLVNVI